MEELGHLLLIKLILLSEYFYLLKYHFQIQSLILKTYANISTTRTRSSEVIDFIEVGWNPAFCYARTVTRGAQALPPLLGEGETMMVVCPSLLICVEHDFLVEEHLCNYLPAFVVLDRISSSQV